jgi:hypothetical protein
LLDPYDHGRLFLVTSTAAVYQTRTNYPSALSPYRLLAHATQLVHLEVRHLILYPLLNYRLLERTLAERFERPGQLISDGGHVLPEKKRKLVDAEGVTLVPNTIIQDAVPGPLVGGEKCTRLYPAGLVDVNVDVWTMEGRLAHESTDVLVKHVGGIWEQGGDEAYHPSS